jgi:hypothetical protein
MSLSKKQVTKLIAELSLMQLQDGKLLDTNAIRSKLEDIIGSHTGLPTLRYRPQKRKQVFNIDHYNDFFERFEFDINIAYSEITDIVASTLMKLNTFDLSYRAQSQQMNEIIDYLDNLLFVIDNANGSFFGVFDNFQSTVKTDLGRSTKDIVDVREGCLSLPYNNLTGLKIKLNHLYEKNSWPITVSRDTISSNHGPAAGFGNAFSDIYSPWRYDIVASTPGPVTIQFDVPLSAISDSTFSITRVQLIPHSGKPMQAKMQYTVDDINYIIFPQTPESMSIEQESKTYNMDFPSTQVEKVRFIITKQEYDEEDQNGNFIYMFGLKHIGFYSLGTATEGQYISKVLKPRGLARNINRVSLVSSEMIPDACTIDYYVCLADSSDNKIGDWQRVVPSNKSSSIPGKRVIEFRNGAYKSRDVHAPSGLTSTETHKGIDFYELPIGIDSGDSNIFASAQLFRGFGGWNRNVNEDVVLRQVKNSYISFNGGDFQNIYTVLNESAAIDSGYQVFPGGNISNQISTKITVSNLIDYKSQSMGLYPDLDINPISDPRPDYAIYKLNRYGSQMSITGEQLTLSGLNISTLSDFPLVSPTNQPVVQETGVQPSGPNSGQSLVYERDIDYVLTTDLEGLFDGGIRIPDTGSSIDSSGQIVSVGYSIDPDITRRVAGIRDNNIYMKSLMNIRSDEQIEAVYRFIPKGKNAVIRPTIKVTSKFGDPDDEEIYSQGSDYSVNINQGSITRIPSGGILPNQGDLAVYIDFYYKETPTDLHTYSTWVYQPSLEPVKIVYNALTLDLVVGEKFIINSPQFTTDLSNSTETPFIPRGWHQIIVKSRDPVVFSTAAIKKIIELKDIAGDYIFVRGGKYFVDLQSTRVAMSEVTYDFLKNSILRTNHDHFAIANGKIVLNFQPGSTAELYNYQGVADTDGLVTFAEQASEDFLLKYQYEIPGQVEARKIMVKITMLKNRVADGGVTPKVFRYNARIG